MRLRDQCQPRVEILLDLLSAALSDLHKSESGLARILVRRMLNHSPCSEPDDRLIRLVGMELMADQAADLGKHDEALSLLQQAADMRDDDDDARYIDLAGMVRIHLDKGNQVAGFELMAKCADTALKTESLRSWVAFDMLTLAQFGDLSVSLRVPAYLHALAAYESRYLADKELNLAESWKQNPERALETLLQHSPYPPAQFGPDSGQDPNVPADD